MKKKIDSHRIGLMAAFISMGLALQYIESKILITPLPGGKLGLPNIISIINLFALGGRNALTVSVIRSFLGSLLTGGIMTAVYSVTGALFSTLFMWLIKKAFYPKIGIIGISIVGAVVHNISQLIVAALFYSSVYVMSYLPVLLILALISGVGTGYAAYAFIIKCAPKENIFI